jgi:peptidoglycan/xylan/chitin deacetylase (PgdA/CDA1 family)
MQVRHLARYYNVLTAGEAARRAREGTLPPRAVCITFDDGYEDNYCFAFPILQKYGLKATIFLATGPVETRVPLWHDRVFGVMALTRQTSAQVGGSRLPTTTPQERGHSARTFMARVRRLGESERLAAVEDLCSQFAVSLEQIWDRTPMLTWAQTREMAGAGCEIGSHTVSHPILSLLPRERQAQEIADSVDMIEKRLGKRPDVFSYPNGREADFNKTTVTLLIKHGIRAAYTTLFGTNACDSDTYYLKRGAGRAHTTLRFAMQMLWYRWTT